MNKLNLEKKIIIRYEEMKFSYGKCIWIGHTSQVLSSMIVFIPFHISYF